jgi:uncharacterized protein (DUF1810 family)
VTTESDLQVSKSFNFSVCKNKDAKKFDTDLFLRAQRSSYDCALAEINRGKKEEHWMWFIFPQMLGLGRSYQSELYGLSGVDVARAFLAHEVLGVRLRKCVLSLLNLPGVSARQVFDSPDDLKLHACLTLFDKASPKDIFEVALERFFGGCHHPDTLRLLEERNSVGGRIIPCLSKIWGRSSRR